MHPHIPGPNVNPPAAEEKEVFSAKFIFYLCLFIGVAVLYGASLMEVNFVENTFIVFGVALPFLGYNILQQERFRQILAAGKPARGGGTMPARRSGRF